MSIEFDPSPHLRQYTHGNKLVTNAWLGAKLGSPGLKVIESDEGTMLYDIGHIPGAIRLSWATDLEDWEERDLISSAAFSALMSEKGITRDDTVVIYGNHSNLWAIYTLWVFELFGHPDVRLLDGGREAWMQEERETSYLVPDYPKSNYTVDRRDDFTNRIFVDELREKLDEVQIIDLRAPEDYAGTKPTYAATASGLPPTARNGHIPGAVNINSSACLLPNSRFTNLEQLQQQHAHLDPEKTTVVYCMDGRDAAQHWFVLKHLLGWSDVRVYDGSWIEWGNMTRLPIQR